MDLNCLHHGDVNCKVTTTALLAMLADVDAKVAIDCPRDRQRYTQNRPITSWFPLDLATFCNLVYVCIYCGEGGSFPILI